MNKLQKTYTKILIPLNYLILI